MSWKTIDRNEAVTDLKGPPVLREAVREKIRSFFPRYDTKRAALLPALHVVQDELGYVSWKAMAEVAELLEVHPSDVLDTISFYTHFWTKPRGKKTVTVCRSISCELMGGEAVLDAVKKHLGVDEHRTTADGAYSLATEECLAGCDHAPCLLINEKLHKRVRPEEVPALLNDANNDQLSLPRSTLFDKPVETAATADESDTLESTSDVREMKEAG